MQNPLRVAARILTGSTYVVLGADALLTPGKRPEIAAETLGVPLGDVRVEIGDSELPPAPGSGGQFGAATAGSAALDAGMNLRKAIAEIAIADPASPLFGGRGSDAPTLRDSRSHTPTPRTWPLRASRSALQGCRVR